MRILLIEDNQKLATSLKKSLESESYIVDIYSDGEEGYTAATIEDYDLLILDLGLPGMDGIEISKKLRKEKNNTPILMLTARDTTKDTITGLDSGADDYLVKPFEFNELLARMRAILRRGSIDRPLIYQIGNLTLDPASHIVKRDNKEISLSGKEYALLEYLIRHPKQIITKTKLLDHVWDNEVDPFSNVIDVYIGYLRKKIDKDFADNEELIHTVKGIGYRLGK